MLNLNYRDLRFLESLVKKDHGDRSDYILQEIDRALAIVPLEMTVIASRKGDDVYIYSEVETYRLIDRVLKLSNANSTTIAIACNSPEYRDLFMESVAAMYPVYSASKGNKTVTISNGAKIYFFSPQTTERMRGYNFDFNVVIDPKRR